MHCQIPTDFPHQPGTRLLRYRQGRKTPARYKLGHNPLRLLLPQCRHQHSGNRYRCRRRRRVYLGLCRPTGHRRPIQRRARHYRHRRQHSRCLRRPIRYRCHLRHRRYRSHLLQPDSHRRTRRANSHCPSSRIACHCRLGLLSYRRLRARRGSYPNYFQRCGYSGHCRFPCRHSRTNTKLQHLRPRCKCSCFRSPCRNLSQCCWIPRRYRLHR